MEARCKAELRMKNKTDETERDRRAIERERKGKGPTPPKEKSKAKGKMKVKGPPVLHVPFVVSSYSEDDKATESDKLLQRSPEDGPNFDLRRVKINDRTLAKVTCFRDEESQEIFRQKTGPGTKNRVHQTSHLASLDKLGARPVFIRYLYKIGFNWFFRLKINTVPLVFAHEFFTTFRFTTTTDLDTPSISFRLLAIQFEISIAEWAVRVGLATPTKVKGANWRKLEMRVTGKHVTFEGKLEWKRVAREGAKEFSANNSTRADIKDPVLRLVQIYLGYNLLGQGSCLKNVSLTELYFMRNIQLGEGVNLAFWLAYQAQQINRCKARYLNLCHIVGAFIANSMDLIYTHTSELMQLCVVPPPYDLNFLIDNNIVRVVHRLYRFYEPGTASSKPRKRARIAQEQVKE